MTTRRRPAFLITIDTEGDNLWAKPRTITTVNAAYLPRFQALCEKHGFRPTWLTNWEMATCQEYMEFARTLVKRGKGEVGMHLHAWNSPPIVPLTADDHHYHPYLVEYPVELVREKVHVLTATLEDTFQFNIRSHRAGRWAFDETYVRVLLEHGYWVDCSVTPHVSWRRHQGVPGGKGGNDYRSFPADAYFLDPDNIGRPGASSLLELPVTILPGRHFQNGLAARLLDATLGSRIGNRLMPPCYWLRPNGRNLLALIDILHVALRDGRDYVEFILHSSELMPGGSPTFPTQKSIERLYRDLEAMFAAAAKHFEGLTLSEYYRRHCDLSAVAY